MSVSGPESKAEILCGVVGLGAAAPVAPRPVPSSAAACCERGRVRLQQPPVISDVRAGGAEGCKGSRRARGAVVQKTLYWQIKLGSNQIRLIIEKVNKKEF